MIRRPSCVITVQYSHSTQSLLTFLSCSAAVASWSVWGSGGRGWADSDSCPGHWGPQGHHHYHHYHGYHHHDKPGGRGWIPGTGDGQSTRGRHSGVNKWTCQDKMLNLFLVKRIAWDRKCHTPLPPLRCAPAAGVSSVIVPGISGCCHRTPHFFGLDLLIRPAITRYSQLSEFSQYFNAF